METLPSTPQQLRETVSELRLAIFAVVVTVGMTLILSFNLVWTQEVNVVVGHPAPDDVFAPKSLTYTSDLETEKAKNLARNSVQEIYTPLDLSIGRAQLAQADAIFSFIDTVRADNNATTEEKISYLQGIDGLEIDETVAIDLLSLSQFDYDEVKDEISRIIDNLMRGEIHEGELESYQRLAQRQASLGLTAEQSNVVTNLVWQFITPTIFPDEEATAEARNEAAASVEPVARSVAEGQRIIRAGEIVTEEDEEMLGQLGLLRQDLDWRSVVSVFLVSLLSVTLILLYWRLFHSQLKDNGRYLAVLAGVMLLFTLAAKGMSTTPGFWALLYPIAMLSMTIAVVFEIRFSILITVIMAAIFGFVAPDSLRLTVYAGVGGLMAIFTLRDAQRIVSYFRSGLFASLGMIVTLIIFLLPSDPDMVDTLIQMLYGLGNGMLSAALTLVGFYILGSAFGIITTLQLQDLSRLDHPLLQELLRKAPGTYHHSIMVANLAEQAAERVNANSTLVRVGAFYHDIGKMNRPPFFTENQEGVNPHDSLDPYTSARIIISHVTDGFELAKRFRLPDRIRDFISEHHGTRIVKGFYHKAKTQAGDKADEVDESKFRYPGPRPRSRESGIVMMADAVEATSSALRPNTPAAIEKLVTSIVDDDLMEGQLNNSGLSLGDIERIKASFIENLKGRYHVRVKYPGNEKLEAPEPAAALPEPEDEEVLSPNPSSANPLLPQDISSN